MEPSTVLAPHLRQGETLLWSGVPDPAVTFSPADRFLIPFSVMWGGFAIFWETSVLVSGDGGLFFALWGIPFVLLGAYLLVGRFFYKKRRKRRTAYGLTPRRAIVVVGDEVADTPVRDVPTTVRRAKDGHVTVTFGTAGRGSFLSVLGPGTRWPSNSGMEGLNRFGGGEGPVSFDDVADGEALLRALDRAHEQVERPVG